MKIGALAGVFGFMINAVVTVLSFVLFRSSADFRRAMQEQMQKQMASNPDPKAQEMLQHFMDWMSSPQGAATFVVLMLLVLGVVFVVITAAGGALGASMVAAGTGSCDDHRARCRAQSRDALLQGCSSACAFV